MSGTCKSRPNILLEIENLIDIEDTSHYFLHCTKHKDYRDTLTEDLNNIPDLRYTDLSVKLLLNPEKKHAIVIREAVFKFIRGTNYQSTI